MADETKQVEETGEVAETTEAQNTTPTMEEMQEKLAALTKQQEEWNKTEEIRKNEIASLNRKVTEEQKAKQDLLKQTETAEQTAQREREEANKLAEQERNDFLNKQAEFSAKENSFNVKVKALEMGFTAEDIEALEFQTVESVEKYKTFLDSKIQATREDQTKNIESALSGNRDNLNNTKVDTMPNALEKAFD